MASLSIGVVGAGDLGTDLAKQVNAVPKAEIAAIADIDENAANRLGNVFELEPPHIFTDYQNMYSSSKLDGVIIGTPHCFHFEQISDALSRDLHVLTEKPLVTDVKQAKEISSLEQKSEGILMVGFQRHNDSAFKIARNRYDGRANDINYIRASITEDWFDLYEGTWRTDVEYSGGGFITDTGRHIIDAVLWVTGLTPESVNATMDFHHEDMELEGTVRIRFKEGATATVAAFGDAESVREEYYICDTDGATFIEGHGWNEGDRRRVEIVDGESWDRRVPHLSRYDDPTKGEKFINCILEEKSPPATVDDSIRVISVIQAARESAQTGEKVTIDTIN